MKKISDKMRLDWVEKNHARVGHLGSGFHASVGTFDGLWWKTGKTLRKAIDAAMKES